MLLGVAVAIAASAHSQSFLTNGLIAYFPFNGNANDASGNANNGVLNGTGITYTTDRFGSNNAAAHFAGGGYVSVTPTPFNVNADYSISFWIKLDSDGNAANNFFSTADDNAGGMNIRVVPNTSVGWAFIPYGPDGIDSTPPANYYVWHAIVCVHQNTNDLMYIDGNLVASGNHTGTTVDNGSIWIGRHQNAATYDLHGAIDDIRMYARALTNGEVAQLYAIESGQTLNIQEAVYVDSSNLLVGTTYQLQLSTNLIAWTDYGAAFTATNSYWRETNYWDVNQSGKLFFRLQTTQ